MDSRASDDRAGAGDEFFGKERFGKVVVGTDVEAVDDVLTVAVARDENDGRGGLFDIAEPFDDVEPAAVAQGKVDDVEAGVSVVGIDEVTVAVIDVHGEPVFLELPGDVTGQDFFVVYDRNPHMWKNLVFNGWYAAGRVWQIERNAMPKARETRLKIGSEI